MKDKELEKYLQDHNINYSYYQHPALLTMEDSFKYTANIEGEHCKNLLLQNKNKSHFYHVLLPADKSINLNQLQESLNETRLSFVSPERLLNMFNVTPGCVNPFIMIKNVPNVFYLIDEELQNRDKLIFCPNYNDESVVLNQKDFQKYLQDFDVKYMKL